MSIEFNQTAGENDGLDLMETLIGRLRQLHKMADVYVGETIPTEIEYPFVWLMQSGEIYEDYLSCTREPSTITVDMEVVSDDIHQARALARFVKRHLHDTALGSLTFVNDQGNNQKIQGIDVEDHDDEYEPRISSDDEDIHIAAIDIQIILGD